MARGSRHALGAILTVLAACGAMCGSFVQGGPIVGQSCSPAAVRIKDVGRRASDGDRGDVSSRRKVIFDSLSKRSPSTAAVAIMTLLIAYILTREEKARKGKICVRSKQYIDDYMADPAKVERLAAKGVPYDQMRAYLQDPNCVDASDYVKNLLTARSFWEAGEEYRVG
ncbi:unnamed protein product [Symbiodinium natans]|uniref:PS II complex 12 kDa extrinsic protein n=1 Tax=Symbiodinium natans TaxID=878477 RepID=A0A812V025_9DINO|nr:unnamed protein product [Symbiodinium natans]